MPAIHSRCWVEIDLSALERNLQRIRAALPEWIRYVAVVKADAYGHGLGPTVTRLMQAGVDMFAVANVKEASAIREFGAGWPILVLSAVLPEEDEALVDCQLTPTVSSADEVERFNRLGRKSGRPIPVHLKVDTGMGRMGVWHEDLPPLLERMREANHLRLEGIYTHFASADLDPEFTELQRARFLQALSHLPAPPGPLWVHADNSAGLESLRRDCPINAVRVGILQFGVCPYPRSLLGAVEVDPVLSFHTRVGLVKELPAGQSVSYGRTCRLERRSRLAVITAGYGDGIPTHLSNRAQVMIRGRRCPILGRVTMDQTIVDVTELGRVEVGDVVTLIGRQGEAAIEVAEFSQWAHHIPWEIFVSITRRVQRVYRTDSLV